MAVHYWSVVYLFLLHIYTKVDMLYLKIGCLIKWWLCRKGFHSCSSPSNLCISYIFVSAYNFELLQGQNCTYKTFSDWWRNQTKDCRENNCRKNAKKNIFVPTISKMLPGTEGSGGIPQENPWKNLVCAIDRPGPFAYAMHNKVWDKASWRTNFLHLKI